METHNECVKRLMKELDRAECDDECRVNLYRIMYQTCQKNSYIINYDKKKYNIMFPNNYFVENKKKHE